MRLRTRIIPDWLWFGIGLMPLGIWSFFHTAAWLFRREEAFWVAGLGLGAAFLFSRLIVRGGIGIRWLIYLLTILVLVFELFRGVLERDFILLGGVVASSGTMIAISVWVERVLRSASMNPGCEWFEGTARALPGLSAEIRVGGDVREAWISRIDGEGAFIFINQPLSLNPGAVLEVRLRWLNREIQGIGRVVALFLGEAQGIGLQFLFKDLYHFNQFSALVQDVRGKGI